jgi:pimeloyl-ACP methyl ester carboxylesterase
MTVRVWMPAVLLACVAVLAGCGKKDDSDSLANQAPREPPREGLPRLAPSADGVPIRYRVYGHGSPALIFIHGWGANGGYWDAQVEHFKATHTVVTLDLAGHGESGTARAEWTMDAFGDDVVAVASRVAEPELVLIGHSMGGPVALEAARRLRARIVGIVGVSTFNNIGLPSPSRDEFERRLTPFRNDYPNAARDYALRSFFTTQSNEAIVRRVTDDVASAPPGIAIGELIGLNEMNYAAALADIDVPIIAINGSRVPTDADRIRLHARTFRVKVVDGAGHFFMLEDPARFNAQLEQVLRELPTTPAHS